MTESETQTAILQWLKTQTHRLDFWRVPVGGVRHGGVRKASPIKGHPDIAGVLHPTGRYFAIEVKQAGYRFYSEQVEWALKLQRAGAVYIAATTLDEVKEGLK